jgi:hypothetical protein
MMYSFASRSDCAVVDEPFYAAYLSRTGLNHPMRDEIVSSQSTDPAQVIDTLLGPVPESRPHFYQKHMTQHMIEEIDLNWLSSVENVFLIRHPVRVVASFARKYENPVLSDLGFMQQKELFDVVQSKGCKPVVIDSTDIRRDPETVLRRLCSAIGLAWDPAMLRWPVGGHRADGVWAKHWYNSVHESEGFAPAERELPELSCEMKALADAAMPAYDTLHSQKI